ncbi:site-specific DNA-methyltransferase [Polaribacter sp. AHE13PA]|uniref:site-specific DNA-methyltransferase n=1 Tax=Polaribacter sp. AHE13PA TaxID=2745562 RepID=UPI001C4E8D6B|nr:site-specific DNA-methyltransferase [Polaribacter sp. AHE13PA]QXP65719.1 site-specific DNA-methyltransferase [Polaribacter sp. AHE13PA]
MDGISLTPEQEKLNALKKVLPEVFAEGKVDWEKLKATLGEDINFSNERYVLNWAGKSEAFKVLQAPTTKTLVPAKGESVNFDETKNIFIEGENLEVLKVLQKSYFGKVKMIYIDPPYNTGNDSFIYPDKFSETKEEYKKRVGDKDEEGYMTKDGMFKKNSKENGQYHSNWLNMMMPRLYLAKNLLKQDGTIFISIDDNEIHNLKAVMNEIFGEDNFEGHIHWRRRHNQPNDKTKLIGLVAEHILCYAKDSSYLKMNGVGKLPITGKFSNPDNDPRGDWASKPWKVGSDQSGSSYTIETPTGQTFTEDWMGEEKTFKELLDDKRIIFTKNGKGLPRKKYYKFEREQEGQCATNWWAHDIFGHNQKGNDELTELFEGVKNVFSNPKPTQLLKSLIQLGNLNKDDIVLDFFAGSASTGDALFQEISEGLNAKFILIQMAERIEENDKNQKGAIKILEKLGKPLSISELSKERLLRARKKILEDYPENKKDLGFKVLKLAESNFKKWQQIKDNNTKALEEQIKLFIDPINENSTTQNMVYELLLKSGKDLNSKIELKDGFYVINDNELVLLLEQVNQKIIDSVIAVKAKKVIALDKLFKGNDQLKTNASLQMKEASTEFKTI